MTNLATSRNLGNFGMTLLSAFLVIALPATLIAHAL
jgi:hypothetical protein